ncbi:hypothetical protein [Aliarcobacter vitoriensis]|uniref:Uncharacterized protein n=1 Tax=Aliarcobacter vitoriensis TaxID=2011099 RepID=A0A366MR19_9BACT|nr:hypothetical protein [Aliarcobacter vitoriensis]RBQ28050.1 hypothetical protein CRU91_11205 [Aliarcobacter vitoriensis]
MYSIKLDVNDKIYDKVMAFLNNISKKDLTIKEIKNFDDNKQEINLVEFFANSPLVGEVELKRESDKYSNRVKF